jgi:serine-type D-Ala-D-Ala carboxypeptidase (penicillin-binding protein 5/6)
MSDEPEFVGKTGMPVAPSDPIAILTTPMRLRSYTSACSLWLLIAVLGSLVTQSAISQSAVMVVDMANRKIHIANGGNDRRSPGGLTKIVSAMVVLDWSEASKVNLNVLATVPDYADRIAGEASPDLRPGDKLTLRDLLYSTMMESDNVAAITLGHFVGADLLYRKGKAGDPLEEFVTQMNALATREGCKNSRFMNPHGFENTRPLPHSTVADMARLSLYAASRAPFHFYTNQKTRTVSIYRGGEKLALRLNNTNDLLGSSRIDGMKAASTQASGGCVAITADRNATVLKQGDGASVLFRHRLVVVVMGSADPFGEARGLLLQGWGVYDGWLQAGRPVTAREQMLPYF